MLYLLKDCLNEATEEDPDEGIRDLVEITLSNMVSRWMASARPPSVLNHVLLQDHDHDGRISFPDFQKSVTEENLLLNAFGVCLPDTTVTTG